MNVTNTTCMRIILWITTFLVSSHPTQKKNYFKLNYLDLSLVFKVIVLKYMYIE